MITTIQKRGNSQGVRLPKTILDVLFLKGNDSVRQRCIVYFILPVMPVSRQYNK